MFLYQAAIIMGIILLLGILVFIVRLKRRGLLAAVAVVLAVAGAGAMFAVQNVFGAHIYEQRVDAELLRRLANAPDQMRSVGDVLIDYEKTEKEGLVSYSKVYNEKTGGVSSRVSVTVSVYPSKAEASRYFSMSQKVYENKDFVPVDSSHSQKEENEAGQRYLVTFIKTEYPDQNDLLYLPSKMSSFSYVIVQDGQTIITMSERARGAVCTKNAVLSELVRRLGA